MLCPACRGVEMHEVLKQGVLIDVCPQCRGVWMDRGELEKMLSAGRSYQNYDEIYGEKNHHHHGEKHPEPHHNDKYEHHKQKKHHKKKSFFDVFEDIFD